MQINRPKREVMITELNYKEVFNPDYLKYIGNISYETERKFRRILTKYWRIEGNHHMESVKVVVKSQKTHIEEFPKLKQNWRE